MTRKYRHRGYMEEERREQKPRPTPKSSAMPRAPKMPGVRQVFRCAMCGTVLPVELGVTYESQCPNCKADLHTCKNCLYFDTSSRFECTQPIPERVTPKDRRNRCEFHKVRITVERETSTSISEIKDPRQAFDRLFKI